MSIEFLRGANLKIEHLLISKLEPYINNARTHSEDQIAQIAASIAEFGFVNPILIGEGESIIAGHGRLLAAKMLELEDVPVIRLEHLSETQRKALVIADNKIAENAGWDESLLKIELSSLKDDMFDLDLLGFSDDDLDSLLIEGTEEKESNEDSAPEVPEIPVSVLGDLWLLDKHRLYCGDATLLDSLEKVMGQDMADMVFTDPPYNVNYANSAKDKMRDKNRPILNDNLGSDFSQFLYDSCSNMMMYCKGAMYVCMSSSELHTLYESFVKAGGKWSTFIIWAKNQFTMGRADYQRQYEPILYGWKDGKDHYWCGDRNQSDVWFVDRQRVNDLHPTMKPVELVEKAIKNSTKSRAIVLDAFGGSGSTLIACEKTHRICRMVELAPKYVDVIIKRWQEYSGKQATLAETSQSFDEIAKKREG